MRKITLIMACCLILTGLLFRLPGAWLDPQSALVDSIASKEYIWEPLRKARIRLYVWFGASPNDIVMGESTYSLAVSKEDIFFLETYAPLVSPEVFLDAIALACEAANKPGRLTRIAKLYQANLHSAPPDCGEEILLTPAPWRGRKRPPVSGLDHEVDRGQMLRGPR